MKELKTMTEDKKEQYGWIKVKDGVQNIVIQGHYPHDYLFKIEKGDTPSLILSRYTDDELEASNMCDYLKKEEYFGIFKGAKKHKSLNNQP